MRYEIKEMGLGGILDQAIALFKNHFGLLFGIALCLMVPYTLLVSFGLPTLVPALAEMPPNPTPEQAEEYLEQIMEALPVMIVVFGGLILLFFLIVSPVTEAATIWAVSEAYLDGRPSVSGAMGFAFKRLRSLLWTKLLASLLITLGMLLFIIPGVILAFRYFLASYVVVIEGKSGGEALKRSGQLMKGNAGRVFVLGFLVAIIGSLVGMVVGLVPVPEVAMVLSAVVQAILFMFGAAAWVVLYFSALCKHENFDLTLLAESLGKGGPGEGQGTPV